jgi:hypothetical protein
MRCCRACWGRSRRGRGGRFGFVLAAVGDAPVVGVDAQRAGPGARLAVALEAPARALERAGRVGQAAPEAELEPVREPVAIGVVARRVGLAAAPAAVAVAVLAGVGQPVVVRVEVRRRAAQPPLAGVRAGRCRRRGRRCRAGRASACRPRSRLIGSRSRWTGSGAGRACRAGAVGARTVACAACRGLAQSRRSRRRGRWWGDRPVGQRWGCGGENDQSHRHRRSPAARPAETRPQCPVRALTTAPGGPVSG